jgi:hypothetical protein
MVNSRPAIVQPSGLPVWCELTLCSRQRIRLARSLHISPSSPAPGQPASRPVGQTLIFTAGCGRVQHWDGPIEEIHPGDVVGIGQGEKHWHAAAPTTAMTHIAIQE